MIKVTQEYVKNLEVDDIIYKASNDGESIGGKELQCFVVNSLNEIPLINRVTGDIAIVNTTLVSGKILKTAYCWNSNHWEALNGNYSANNVYFDENLRFNKQFGKYNANITGYTIPSHGKSLKEVLLDAFYVTPVYYTVQFNVDSNKGTVTSGNITQTIESGKSAVAPTVSPKNGWSFTRWDKSFDNITSNLIVNAVFTEVQLKYWGYRLKDENVLDVNNLTQNNILNDIHVQSGSNFPTTLTYPTNTKQIFLLAPNGLWNKKIIATDTQGGGYAFNDDTNIRYANKVQINGVNYDLWYYTQAIAFKSPVTLNISWINE